MRTTVRLNEHLLDEAKKMAAKRGQTLTALIEEGLRQILQSSKKSASKPHVKLMTFKGDGLSAGVDLDHTSELLDLMDDRA
jgi:predicted DNA-binding ribbon-helix-helix protein